MKNTKMPEQITIPNTIKVELKTIVENIKASLGDNNDFYIKLIQSCMSVGKGIYWDNIQSLIYTEYPKLLDYESGYILLQNTRKLIKLLCLESSVVPVSIKEMLIEEQYEFRNLLEQEMLNFNNISVELLGDNCQ